MLMCDASRPLACKRESQGFGLANAGVGMLRNVGKQAVDFIHYFLVAAFNEELIVGLGRFGEY
jgi:hypothetical protein